MKFRKIIFSITMLLTLFCVGVLVSNFQVSASSEYEYIPTTKGTDLTYRGTTIKVEVPKNYEQKTTEFRGVWVSPFAGDISGFTQTAEIYKKELLSVLDTMEKYNLNAIVFHIRTHNDAFYDTKLAPKSQYISAADFTKWDYLEWFIEECHSRGIEFHAWLNPYRISSTKTTMTQIQSKYQNYRSNPARDPENVLISTSTSVPGAILDPGRPAVKEYLVDVCMEIIKKYDVDAIHFDDYFYQAGIDDSATYNLYKADYNNVSVGEFRRLQIDDFIRELSEEMYDYNIKNNRCVQLGISPSGVYQNGGYTTNYVYDENGTLVSPSYSNTAGYAHYDTPLYSDTKKWIDNEWIDYITPQLYGSFESTGCCYADAVDWWSQVVKYKKVNLYTGLGIYKSLNDKSDIGWNTTGNKTFEYILKYNQTHEQVDGFCLYQYRTIKNSVYNNPDLSNVFNNMLTNKAAVPEIPRYTLDISSPTNLKLVKGEKTTTLLFDSVDNAYKYAIYRTGGQDATIDTNDVNQLVAVIGDKKVNSINFDEIDENYTYGVRAINQANEFSDLVVISGKEAKTEIDFPFGEFNNIEVSGTIASKGYYVLSFEKASIYVGEEAKYKVYSSLDGEKWEMVQELQPLASYNLRFQFNDYLHPVYYKIVMENSFGEIESGVIVIDFRRVDLLEIFEYSLNDSKENFLDIFR